MSAIGTPQQPSDHEPDIATEIRSFREWMDHWGDGPNWCDPKGESLPTPKLTLRRLIDLVEAGHACYQALDDYDQHDVATGAAHDALRTWEDVAAGPEE